MKSLITFSAKAQEITVTVLAEDAPIIYAMPTFIRVDEVNIFTSPLLHRKEIPGNSVNAI